MDNNPVYPQAVLSNSTIPSDETLGSGAACGAQVVIRIGTLEIGVEAWYHAVY